MRLRHKIAQMLMMGFDGVALESHNPVVSCLKEEGLGGVILFDKDLLSNQPYKNLKTRQQITRLTQGLHELSDTLNIHHGRALPLLIGLDYEGGHVDRLANIPGCIQTMPPIEMSALSPTAFCQQAEKMALELKHLGFNLNFAPVVDLSLNNEQGILGKLGRCFASDAEKVTAFARDFIEAFARHGLICSLKHFPGHGSAAGDTHLGFVDVTDTYQSSELLPYKTLLKESNHLLMVMTAHVINRRLDPKGLPATLSYPIMTDLLRHELQFDGVVISDDLQMKAISGHFSLSDSLEKTINAGADMLIFANQLAAITPVEVINEIEHLVARGNIREQRIDESYHRIVKLKTHLNIN